MSDYRFKEFKKIRDRFGQIYDQLIEKKWAIFANMMI